jgi:hypothetical protein
VIRGRPVRLTRTEWRLLEILLSHPGQLLGTRFRRADLAWHGAAGLRRLAILLAAAATGSAVGAPSCAAASLPRARTGPRPKAAPGRSLAAPPDRTA